LEDERGSHQAGLRDLPILSIVMKTDDMFGTERPRERHLRELTLKGSAYQKPQLDRDDPARRITAFGDHDGNHDSRQCEP
jgi:hypothetical protein